MEKEITKKISRFIKLSGQFSKSLHDVLPDDSHTYNNGSFHGTLTSSNGFSPSVTNSYSVAIEGNFLLNGREIYIDTNGDVKSRDNKALTRADAIRAKAEIKAKLSDDFDEYNKLRNELENYFSALNKIIE